MGRNVVWEAGNCSGALSHLPRSLLRRSVRKMRDEEPPNQIVHAEDLAAALAKLHADAHDYPSPTAEDGDQDFVMTRRRTGSSTILYHPEDHGDSPNLPAIAVVDTTENSPTSPGDAMEGIEGHIAQQKAQGKTLATARPPVELMH